MSTNAAPKTQTPRAALELWSAAQAFLVQGDLDGARDIVLSGLSALVARNAELELLLRQLQARSRGATSEKVNVEQLSLLTALLAHTTPEESEPNVEAEAAADAVLDAEIEDASEEAAEAAQDDAAGGGRTKQKSRNAALRLDSLTTVETVLPIPDDKLDWRLIGYDETVRLRFQAAHFYRELIKAPVMEAPELDDEGNTVIVKCTEGVRPTLLKRCIADVDVIAAVLVQKYERHMPLHRLHRAFLADQKLDIPVSTLCDWAKLGGQACERLACVIEERLRAAWFVQTDATGLRVNDPVTGVYRGTFWCAIGHSSDPEEPPDILFTFAEDGTGESGPWTMFKDRTGYLMADAANIYDRVYNGLVGSATEVGCNAHAVRNAKELLPQDPRAAYIVQLVRRAYRVETLADTKKMSFADRAALRQERTRPIFEQKLKPYLLQLIQTTTPTDPIHKAARYYINHWAALTRFIEEGRLPLDNNAVESALRVIRLGENNYLFAGSTEAAKRTAAILTVLASARTRGLNTTEYLTSTFAEIAKRDAAADVSDLVPKGQTPSTTP